MNHHPMNLQQIARIQELARTIPVPPYQTSMCRVKGTELLAMGYTHWNGVVIDPAKSYAVQLRKETNLVRRLMSIYEQQGEQAVLDHVHAVRTGTKRYEGDPVITTITR